MIAFAPPAAFELGNATGFDFELEDIGDVGHAKLLAARNQLLGMARQDKGLAQVRPNGLDDVPQLKLNIDQARAGALGLSLADINTTVSAAFGGAFVNQFIDRGRVKKVYIQADAPFRTSPEDLDNLYVRGADRRPWRRSRPSPPADWIYGPTRLERYNGHARRWRSRARPRPARAPARPWPGWRRWSKKLPPGIGYEWTGLSYEEKASGGAGGIALRALAAGRVPVPGRALRELVGADRGAAGGAAGRGRRLLAAHLTGLDNDIYFQVGLITTIGVSAKNAILIVEFAEERLKLGMSAAEAALAAAKLRLRPILMTSFAFIFGVLPLAHRHRRRLGQPERHRPRRGRRHAVGDRAGDLLRAGVLHRGEAACSAQDRPAPPSRRRRAGGGEPDAPAR